MISQYLTQGVGVIFLHSECDILPEEQVHDDVCVEREDVERVVGHVGRRLLRHEGRVQILNRWHVADRLHCDHMGSWK